MEMYKFQYYILKEELSIRKFQKSKKIFQIFKTVTRSLQYSLHCLLSEIDICLYALLQMS